MKLYTFPQAPSPRRVHLFLAEKGLELDQEIVDLRAGEHLEPGFARCNPDCTVPVLKLGDGTHLSECAAICRYLEEFQPDPPLVGTTPEQRARINDRDHWVEMNGLLAVMEGFRNALPGMKDHALPGRRPVAQIAELVERGKRRFEWFMEDLDTILAESGHVADDDFTIADITALVTLEFGLRGLKIDFPQSRTNLARWHKRVSQRPAFTSEAAGSG